MVMKDGYEKPLKILIVDDQKPILELVAWMLKSIFNGSSEIYMAENGLKALEIARAVRFDHAFIDMQMPGIDGVQTLRELKKVNPDMAAVMMTGGAPEEMIEAALGEGAEDCLRKPFGVGEIKEYLAKRSSLRI